MGNFKWTPAKRAKAMNRICGHIINGGTLGEALTKPNMPVRQTFHRWLDNFPDNAAQYARARTLAADADAEKVTAILRRGIREAKRADPQRANAIVHAHRHLAEGLKWAAASKNRIRYSDHMRVSGDPNAPVHVTVTARERVKKRLTRLEKRVKKK